MTNHHIQRVTWLLPVRNGMAYLPRTLESITSQTYRNFQIIAWDNGSTDGTVDALRQWIPSRLPGRVIATRPLGLGASLAAMVEMADTPYCARIDADDLNEPHRLEAQVRFLDEHPEIAVVGSAVRYIDANDRLLPDEPTLVCADAEIRWRLRFCNALNHPTVMFRRAAILEAGNYRDVMPIEDFDLWVRVARRHAMANLPAALVRYRVHGGSVSANHRHRIDAIRRQVIEQYAAQLFPGVEYTALRRLYDLVQDVDCRDVTWRDCAAYRAVASRAGVAAGRAPGYFRNTELFRTQMRSLIYRWIKAQPVLGSLWAARKRAA